MIQLGKWIAATDYDLLVSLNLMGGTPDHVFLLNFAFENFHISDSIGVFAARTLGAPLKLDLARRGLTTKDTLLNTARNLKVSENEVNELDSILSSRVSYLNRNLIQRLVDIKI